MEDHPRVLQERIQVRPLGRRRKEPQERVRGREDEEVEPERDEKERPQNAREHLLGKLSRRERHGKDPPGERRNPEEDRALVRAPDGGELVEPRQRVVGILRYVEDRKIARHECVGKRTDRKGCGKGKRNGGRRTGAHPASHVKLRARQRQEAPYGTDDKRQDKGEMPDLCCHGGSPLLRGVLGIDQTRKRRPAPPRSVFGNAARTALEASDSGEASDEPPRSSDITWRQRP